MRIFIQICIAAITLISTISCDSFRSLTGAKKTAGCAEAIQALPAHFAAEKTAAPGRGAPQFRPA